MPARKKTSSPKDSTAHLGFEAKLWLADGVEARATAIDHLEAELDRQITRSNRLRQSTLAASFGGTL